MIPAFSDRRTDWPSHPYAQRDSLHEAEMWAVEGLTHRYPTKVLAELLPTCPQYCGHCTRMDLVGNPTAQTDKHKFAMAREDRLGAMLDYLRRTPGVRDVVVSGGDVANLPWPRLESFVAALLEIDSIRDIRLASKALMGLPQHWLSDEVRAGMARLAGTARSRGVSIAIHTHVNAAQSVTPLVARAAAAMLEAGVRDVRNQGVLLRGVNNSTEAMLDLCFALLDGAAIMPYYFYMCDMIPGSEHWRLSLAEGQALQHDIMGYLPGFATPRVVCDVPYVGKRWVHQVARYDTERGISYWTKNYHTAIEADDELALSREYPYYDPIYLLPESGQAWWRPRPRGRVRRRVSLAAPPAAAPVAGSRSAGERRAQARSEQRSRCSDRGPFGGGDAEARRVPRGAGPRRAGARAGRPRSGGRSAAWRPVTAGSARRCAGTPTAPARPRRRG